MQLNITTDYAIRTVLYLAQKGKMCTSQEIATSMTIPYNYLSKILKQLKEMKLVNSIQGKNGGFILMIPPKDITLLQLIEGIDGTVKINRCLELDKYCNRNATEFCSVRKCYSYLQTRVDSILSKITIEDILEESFTDYLDD